MSAGTKLQASRDELASFISSLFRYADVDTYVSLRAFDQFRRDRPPELIRTVRIYNGDFSALIERALQAADHCANADHPVVFAPPVCTFTNPKRARSIDLANGITLAVELDEGNTPAAMRRLEGILGPVTLAIASGGTCHDPATGEVHDKLHLHWRLSEPTRSDDEHQRLRHARDYAARLVGADPTGKPVNHPLRWPGSWNTKDPDRPRMARITAENQDAEIHLDEALDALTEAVEAAGLAGVSTKARHSEPDAVEAPLSLLQSAMAAIPNDDVHYDDWIRFGYACWRATGGTDQGFELWDSWSRKSDKKYQAGETATSWGRIEQAIGKGTAPRTIGAGSIFFFATQAGWRRPDLTDDPGYQASVEAEVRERGVQRTPEPDPAAVAACTHVWRSEDHDYPCTPLDAGVPHTDGTTYVHVRLWDGTETYAPEDRLFTKQQIVEMDAGFGRRDRREQPPSSDLPPDWEERHPQVEAQDELPPEGSDDNDDATIARLSRLKPLAYERAREAEASQLGIRVALLDRLVKAARGDNGNGRVQGRPVELPLPDQWPDPVNGAALLVDLTSYFADYLHAPPRTPVMLALWTLHTYCYRLFRHTPRLNFKSVTKRSGKTTALDLLQMVVAKPLQSENISVAAMFRVVETAAPTLLIDEADGFLRDNPELVSLLNAGYAHNGQAVRCIGDDAEPRAFSVFAPAAIAGIGMLPGTLTDRSIVILLQRARRDEQKAQINSATEAKASGLARRAARWASDNAATLEKTVPDMGRMFARAAQIWTPLYAIAEVVGDNWSGLVRKASEALMGADDDAEALSVRLLGDMKAIFDGTDRDPPTSECDELPTEHFVTRLLDMAERPWPEMPRTNKPITANAVTRLLKALGIPRKRLTGGVPRPWGYRRDDFADAWGRYLDA